MQAMETKGYGMHRIGIAALAIAALAASIIGVITVYDMIQDSENSAVAVPRSIQQDDQVQMTRFFEDNVWEYTGSASRPSAEEIQFLEQNSFDYGFVSTARHLRFMDAADWAYLQSTRTGQSKDGMTAQDYRFLEENIWETTPASPYVEHDERNY